MIVAFLGPSLPPVKGIRVLPPAQQGDIWRALELKPKAIALIDGVFESQPSVWHHEILDALDCGVAVFGGASMGALRAAELHTFGMIGVGQIFRWYRDEVIIDDSEVALLHADAEHAYRPLTVPLVNVRWAAQQAARARILRPADARALVRHAEKIFYQERTWPAVLDVLPARARERWSRWGVPDLKADDAREVLQAALAAGPARPPNPRKPAPSSLVRALRMPAGDLWSRSDARELADRGLRRALLAGWARELGLKPGDISSDFSRIRRKSDKASPDFVLRLAEDLALERLVLDHAARMINGGPTPDEALMAELLLGVL